MKSKTFIILLVIFCVLAGAVYLTFFQKEKISQESGLSRLVFENVPVEKISSITIQSNEGTVNLKKDDSVWVVEKKSGYLADFSLITQLVNYLKTSKFDRSFEGSADSMSRLGLHPPDNAEAPDEEKGIQVMLKNAQGDLLLDVIIGKTREGDNPL